MEGNYYLGQILIFAGNFIPRSWDACAGQLLPIAQNQALYSLLGTMYGGDGRTTFGLPDLRGTVPVGVGQRPGHLNYPLASHGGFETTTLNSLNLPPHHHGIHLPLNAVGTIVGDITAEMNINNSDSDGGETGSGHFLGHSSSGDLYATSSDGSKLNADAISVDTSTMGITVSGIVSGDTLNAGSGQMIDNRSPYLTLNWIICTDGLYPSRK